MVVPVMPFVLRLLSLIISLQVSSIIRHGFTRVLLLNGHGGNDTALQNISQELSQELNATVAKASCV
eukprot:SAG31_NODE_664_length_12996_cov_4.853997_8_plen_67_part_00